jgi:hypothetical protein
VVEIARVAAVVIPAVVPAETDVAAIKGSGLCSPLVCARLGTDPWEFLTLRWAHLLRS